jgi:ABC-2 type transport system permease protein
MTSRAKVYALLVKEFKESFNGPTPYLFLTVFFLVTGYLQTSGLFLRGQANVDNLLGILPILLSFFIPAMTMRLFAEEYKTGTVETLATLPLTDVEIVLGKYAAALVLWALALGLAGFHVVLLAAMGRPDLGQAVAGYLGAFLLGALYTAAGLFASSLTRSQVVGFLFGFLFSFGLFLVAQTGQFVPGIPGRLIAFISVNDHYESFLKGLVDTRDVLYFLSGIALFLAGTLAAFNSRRWR